MLVVFGISVLGWPAPALALEVGPESYRDVLARIQSWQATPPNRREMERVLGSIGKLEPPFDLLARALAVGEIKGPEEARRLLEALDVSSITVESELAVADVRRRMGAQPQARTAFLDIAERNEGSSRALAACGLSELELELGDFVAAIVWLERARGVCVRAEGSERDADLLARIDRALVRARRLRDLTDLGPGFVLYADARRAEIAGEWGKASTIYAEVIRREDENRNASREAILALVQREPSRAKSLLLGQPIEPVYLAAARCYRGRCLVRLGHEKEALRELGAFIDDDPQGPYRGEALLLVGDISFGSGAFEEASQRYAGALRWAGKVAALSEAALVPERARRRTASPQGMRQTDAWGNDAWSIPGPESVVYRGSSPWYLDRLAHDIHVRLAACAFAAGSPGDGIPHLEAMHQLDEGDQRKRSGLGFSNFQRLRDGFVRGKLYATANELALFKAAVRGQVILAEILFEMERWDEAIASYRVIIDHQGNRLSTDARAYLHFALASALLYAGVDAEADQILTDGFAGLRAPYARSQSAWRAYTAMASMNRGAEAIAWLERAHGVAPGADARAQTLLRLGQHLFLMQDQESARRALRCFEALQSSADEDDPYWRSASQYRSLIIARWPSLDERTE